jgi:DNA segregation ATPase FtsK/SpoIIIE, S-DNA-T family
MEKKIIRIQLYLLFALTALNLVYFYSKDGLPDNFFEISYQNQSINFFSYYFISLLANFGYWCGIWVTVGFIAFAVLHSLVLSKKPTFKNSIIFLSLMPFILVSSYVLLPETLGDGLRSVMTQHFDTLSIVMSFLFFGLASFYLISESAFLRTCKYCTQLCYKLFKKIQTKEIPRLELDFAGAKKLLALPMLKDLIGRSTEDRPELQLPVKRAQVPVPAPSVQVTPDDEEQVEEVLDEEEEFESEDFSDQELDEEEFYDEEDGEEELEEEDDEPIRQESNKFFASDELIDCIVAKKNVQASSDPDDQYFVQIARAIEEKLKEFNISANIINVLKGPVVDTFELELGPGVKVSGVTNRTDDLSLALRGAPIRMNHPMKGKSTIGIEVPRNPRDVIYLDEVLKSPQYHNSNFRLPIAMGKDAYGEPAIIDLAGTPHLLVAGTTGAGKSVFINTLLVSLIIKFSPKQLRLIMLDPKQLELAPYSKLPHLIMPIVTDPQIASVALIWAIEEMERRYTLLKDFGVKNIEGFNKKVKSVDEVLKAKITKYYPDVEKEGFELPYLVIVVDEFADLMLSKSGKAIETSISRLAAKARASGIHIVLATQRPSTDIITGVIKANFPTRVSFRVFTNIDSRVILDGVGAEKLLGKGDMLFKQGIDVLRMHSAYVEEDEIENLVEKLSSIPSEFDTGAMEFIQNNGITDTDVEGITMDGEGGSLKDDKFEEAVRIVAMHRSASASALQRRLGVGYNRAANLIEEMERQGIVGPAQGSKPRKVLIPPPSDSTP